MTFSPSSAALGGLVLGGGRKLGGMIDKRMDGANMVHAVAIQGMFNAHAQQQEHEHHLASIREAYKMAPGGGFSVKTGGHEIRVGETGGSGESKPTPGSTEPASSTPETPFGGGHDENGNRTAGNDHYENAANRANPATMRSNYLSALASRPQGNGAQELTAAAKGTRPAQPALPAARLALPAGSSSLPTASRGGRVIGGSDVKRVNGAIPMGGPKTVKGRKK